MNFRLILNIMGYTLWVEAGCLLLPLMVRPAGSRFCGRWGCAACAG